MAQLARAQVSYARMTRVQLLGNPEVASSSLAQGSVFSFSSCLTLHQVQVLPRPASDAKLSVIYAYSDNEFSSRTFRVRPPSPKCPHPRPTSTSSDLQPPSRRRARAIKKAASRSAQRSSTTACPTQPTQWSSGVRTISDFKSRRRRCTPRLLRSRTQVDRGRRCTETRPWYALPIHTRVGWMMSIVVTQYTTLRCVVATCMLGSNAMISSSSPF